MVDELYRNNSSIRGTWFNAPLAKKVLESFSLSVQTIEKQKKKKNSHITNEPGHRSRD